MCYRCTLHNQELKKKFILVNKFIAFTTILRMLYLVQKINTKSFNYGRYA